MLTSIRKATAILEALGSSKREWTVAELSRELRMPSPTVHHFLASFRKSDWVVQNPTTKRYRLGIKLWEIGCAAINHATVVETARPILRKLAADCDEMAMLGTVPLEAPTVVVFLERIDSTHSVRVISDIGSRVPAHASAIGKAVVAHNAQYEERLLSGPLEARTERTMVDRKALRAEFATIRRRGYSTTDSESMLGMVAIAAPVFDASGVVTLGAGIWVPKDRMPRARIARTAGMIVNATRELSRGLGSRAINLTDASFRSARASL